MTREDDPLKQTPAAELDRDNRAMTREPEDVASVETLLVERAVRAEVERLLGVCKDKTVLLKDAYAEIERLTNAIRRIDGINDNPAKYNPAIDDVCGAILRPHLERKP